MNTETRVHEYHLRTSNRAYGQTAQEIYTRGYNAGKSDAIKALEQQPVKKCTWIKYDYRTMCPKEHDVDNPYWRIPENRMETLKYCPYCGKEIEVSE